MLTCPCPEDAARGIVCNGAGGSNVVGCCWQQLNLLLATPAEEQNRPGWMEIMSA
jgi:hypothetical protein